MKGLRVLVTAGPTQESIDPVRYITNHSTGKMGYAIAKVCMQRGADVTLVTGPIQDYGRGSITDYNGIPDGCHSHMKYICAYPKRQQTEYPYPGSIYEHCDQCMPTSLEQSL